MPNFRADALVVLGRSLNPDGSLSVLGAQRVQRAAALYHAGIAPAVIFTGRCSLMVDEPPVVTEAAAMAAYAATLGLPAERILLEEEARDTVGNAYFVQRRILDPRGWTTIRVVTSDFHIPRTNWVFQKVMGAGYDVSYSPSNSELFATSVALRAREESDIATFLMDWLGALPDGNRVEMDRVIWTEHPGYAERPTLTKADLQQRMNEIAMVHRSTDTGGGRGHRARQVRVAEL